MKKIDPEVRAIATSGYSEDPVISKPEEYSFYGAIPKPHLKKPFLELIRKAVSEK